MGIVFGAIAPHGWTLIPDLSDDAGGAMANRHSMEELARRMAATNPEVIVISTPHGVRVDSAIALANVARGAGTLHHDGNVYEMNLPLDMPLTKRIADVATERGIPIALTGFAGNQASESAVPLDWGTMVPLAFLGHPENRVGFGHVLADVPPDDHGPTVVIVSPSRRLPRDVNIEFGKAVAEAAAADGRRIAFVASCDWAHAHAGSRYGESPAAAIVDGLVVEAMRSGNLVSLVDLDQTLVENAAIDGLWQALMLAGVQEIVPMKSSFIGYEVAVAYYTGMAVGSFEPD